MIWQSALRDKRNSHATSRLRLEVAESQHPGLPSEIRGLHRASIRTQEARGAGAKGRRRRYSTGTPGLACRTRSARPAGQRARVGGHASGSAEGFAGVTRGASVARPGGVGARMGKLVTVWFTPHIRTLRIGSLARNSFTFWHTKCFFLVLVLLALSGATATAVVLVQLDDMPGAAAAAKGGVAETAHQRAAPGLPRTDPHPRCLTEPWSRPSRYLPTPPRWFRPPHAPPSLPRPAPPRGTGQPVPHPASGRHRPPTPGPPPLRNGTARPRAPAAAPPTPPPWSARSPAVFTRGNEEGVMHSLEELPKGGSLLRPSQSRASALPQPEASRWRQRRSFGMGGGAGLRGDWDIPSPPRGRED